MSLAVIQKRVGSFLGYQEGRESRLTVVAIRVVVPVRSLVDSRLGPEVLVHFAVAVFVHPDALAAHFQLNPKKID
jgi:hypothetical protein